MFRYVQSLSETCFGMYNQNCAVEIFDKYMDRQQLADFWNNMADNNDGSKAMLAMNDAFDGKVLASRPHDRYEECTEFDVITDFSKKKSTFIVFESEEARDKAVEDHIRDSIELFTPEFIQSHLQYKLPIEAIVAIQGTHVANKLFLEMLTDFDSFVQDAIGGDGCGHFLATYDHAELDHEFDEETYYYYKIDEVNVDESA